MRTGSSSTQLVRSAAEWRLLGLLFERKRPDTLSEIRSLSEEIADALLGKAADRIDDVTSAQYIDALGPGGLVPAREVAYRGREDPGQIIADVSGFYDAFAFKPTVEDPPDHVAVECGFVGYLFLKQAYAVSAGDQERTQLTCGARERFVDAHLQHFARPLAERLVAIQHPVLSRAALALQDRVGPAPVPVSLDTDMEALGGDHACGSCGPR